MTDNELYNHFKTRRHTLDENPGDALWSSITAKMDNPKASGKGIISLIIVTITTIGVSIYLIIPQETMPSIQQDNLPIHSMPTDTSNTITSNKTVIIQEEVKEKQATESKPIINTSTNNTLAKPTLQNKTLKSNHLSSNLNSIKPEGIGQDTVKPSGIKLFTQKYNGRILIQVKEKITQTQFDSLIDASFDSYKKEYNTLLIVRAPNLKPYRTRITKYSKKPSADTLKSIDPGFVRFMPIYKAQLDTLTDNKVSIKSGNSPNNEAVRQPSYPGGLDMLMKHVNEKLIIPDNLPNGVYKVYAHLNINPEGSISKIEIMRKAGHGLDEAVIEAVKKIKTKWEPMVIDGKPTNSSFVIPITITIR